MTNFKISNVKKANCYNSSSAYAKIFRILEADRIFTESVETEESIGFVDGDYFLEVEEDVDFDHLEKILKIKNVTLINK